jgi:hypothetical protein
MKVQIARTACMVALGAVTGLTLASTAYAYLPTIISSFRMSGTAPPYARGVYVYGYWYGIFYAGEGYNYLYKFDRAGSLLSTVRLPRAVRLGDAEHAPPGFPLSDHFGVVDEGANDVKVYNLTGSFVGTWRAVSTDTVGYARWGYYGKHYAYLGRRDGRVFVYGDTGSLVNSYTTAVELADLAADESYASRPGDYLVVGPRRTGDPVRVYFGPTGSLLGTFSLPGWYNVGASSRPKAYYYCLRRTASEIWAYEVDIGAYMPVEPASLGKVKALYK